MGPNIGDGKIIVEGLNLISDSKENTTSILFADNDLKGNIANNFHTTENNEYQTEAFSPIFKFEKRLQFSKTGAP